MKQWSLRRRLLVLMAALVVAGLALADVATYRTLRSYLMNREDQTLTTLAHGVGRSLLFGRPGFGGGNGVTQAYIQVRDSSGEVVQEILARAGTQTALPAPDLPPRLQAAPSAGADPIDAATYLTVRSKGAGHAPYRVRVSALSEGPIVFQGDTLVVATPLTDVLATMHKLIWTEVGVSAAALVLAVLLGSWLVRLGLRPLDHMTDTAGEIAAGRLDRRVDVTAERTEVGRLGAALNSMLGRIEDAFAEKEASESRLRRFVADASHELRTPLTSIRGYAELFRRGADRRPEDLAKVMSRIEAEATRMGFLVEDLLLLARLDQGRPPENEVFDLAGLVTEAVDAARAVEPDRSIDLDQSGPVVVLGDRNRLRQVVDNLLANIRVHTPAGAPARVSLAAREGRAVLEVADSGPGLPDDQADQVFERFFRADSSRSTKNGGVGLGLSIVRAIAESHGGTARAGRAPGGGALFTVAIPLAPEAESTVPGEPEAPLHDPWPHETLGTHPASSQG